MTARVDVTRAWAARLRRAAPALRTVAATLAAAQAAPALTALPGVRACCLPGLNGGVGAGRVALTFDDGPDPESTPWFLAVLAEHSVRATFFVLGSMLDRSPQLGRRIADAGHEVAVHGWDHHNLLLRGPVATWRDLVRTRDLVTRVTGRAPRYFRPPYGVLTGSALFAARRLDLRPVLWTCWGRDWTRTATSATVYDTVRAGLGSGGTVLLHDSDCTSAPGAWRSSLGALPRLLAECRRQGWSVGPLGEQRAAAR
ncbi:polysaccharide deacetylase family protein [Micromonospora sp. NPDC050686]|uniref:polysaccharide deacetylase family protein n=1 Tax=Micromonospora sp. NPDC050686 TaxID=3154631 RepID=UPI0033DB1F7C